MNKEGEDYQSARPGNERIWLERYNELVDFYNANGDCAVPSDYEPNRRLGNWVRTQRAQFKLYKEGEPSNLTPERIELLDKINFQWKLRGDWIRRFRELEHYFNYHGHSGVPTNWVENPSLGRWVDRQRTAYKLFMAGNATTMTQERIDLLETLNFQWKVRDDWFERYDELVAYFNEHGNSLVPAKYALNPSLAKWVDTQRQQYKLFIQNKPSSMTLERVDHLKKVNFQWKLLEDWTDRFRELEKYVDQHGSTLVPQHYAENPSLGIWVRNQRTQFKLYKAGKQSKLTPERIKMLESLNFEWNAYEAKWMACYVELGKYVRAHGFGTLPSYHDNRSLRCWAEEQRKQYRKLLFASSSSSSSTPSSLGGGGGGAACGLTGGESRLTTKRKELLDFLAFPWPERSRPGAEEQGDNNSSNDL
ncbi:hypothetical protein ACA910_015564 [Epithemia clementina (nom. ined.)]